MRSKIRLPSWTFINARCLREMAAADKLTCIKDLRPGTKNVTCVFIVIDGGTSGSFTFSHPNVFRGPFHATKLRVDYVGRVFIFVFLWEKDE